MPRRIQLKTDWQQVLSTWMREPVDKTLELSGRHQRATDYLCAALGKNIKTQSVSDYEANQLPLPTPGPNGEHSVTLKDGPVLVYHPVSAHRNTRLAH